ncbi:PSD1 and planctomycete cytochrome C domain-containing protein [Bremerella cremea]|uniref:PSD1 and planctomycete cytochrome C domain-containing protein n=1 Tax=Bremerella cremea TaxID=1031537 RepID=UPI0031E751BF
MRSRLLRGNWRWMAFSVCLVTLAGSAQMANAEGTDEIDFNRDIRPLLSDRCYACHGPDENHRAGGIRFDQAESAYGEADSGEIAIVPGKPDESELIARIISHDESIQMPPSDSNKKLSLEEIEILRRWIAQGAKYQSHWSFEVPHKSDPPQTTVAGWGQTEIDRFLAARLEKEKLIPSAEADKRTLIRRVTFTLTGMPATIEEVDAFLADESPDAYEKVVDRLLASPKYGEHMARHWLDAARFADTHGLHLDNFREMWMYRDWVIQALNENKPYDVFLTEQLAGDLLPNPSWEQKVASGFNRCNVTTNEGGSITEEVKMRNVNDRVVTTGTVFMGLTMDCTRCHDHKYDPLKQKDFYAMYAFFNSIDGSPMDGNVKDHAPSIYSKEAVEQIASFDQQIKAKKEETQATLAKIDYQDPGPGVDNPEVKAEEIVWIDDAPPEGGAVSGNYNWVAAPEPVFSGEKSAKRTSTGNDQVFFTGAKAPLTIFKGDVMFGYVYLDPKNPPREIMFQWNDGDWDQRAYWGEDLIPYGKNGSTKHRLGDLPEAGKWVRLEIPIDKVKLKEGAKINGWAFTQFDGTVYWDKAGVVTKYGKSPQFKSMVAWSEYAAKNLDTVIPENKQVTEILKKPADQRNEEDGKKLQRYFLEFVCADTQETFDKLRADLKSLTDQRSSVVKDSPTTLIYKEAAKPVKAFILERGEYDQIGEEVTREVPSFLPPMTEEMPRDRLGLAMWLLAPNHPLTARVAVNRYWQHVFGTGLVKTSEDFGSQGSVPSHPQLLDNLAVEFRENGWDIKRLMKRMVMTAAYRQSSDISPEMAKRDPENRLLARGPRFRLDAESLRDQALAVSGLLVDTVGGPSVKPPQPDGLWKAVGYSGSNTVQFKADEGHEKIHRRTLYTFIKRTALAPQLSTFDAPNRESCTVRRERTNTPLQALLLLNDPQYVEAAVALAGRTMDTGGADPVSKIDYLISLCLLDPENQVLRKELESLYFDSLTYFQDNPEAASKLVGKDENPAELAAWAIVCNTILNLDEVVTLR